MIMEVYSIDFTIIEHNKTSYTYHVIESFNGKPATILVDGEASNYGDAMSLGMRALEDQLRI